MHTNAPDHASGSAPKHAGESASSRHFLFSLISTMVSVLAIAAGAWIGVGVLLRLTGLRDRFDGLSAIYYSTPWPVVAAGVALLGLRAWLRHRHRIAILHGILAIGSGIAWISTSWQHAASGAGSADLRVFFWNAANREDLDEIAPMIREFSPDIVALAEAGNHLSNLRRWRELFPEYTVERLPQQMLTMSRTGLQRGKRGPLAPGSSFGTHTTTVGESTVTVLQADLHAQPFRSRRAALEALTTRVREHAGQPLILLGDFNTPRESWHLDPIRGMMQHTFEARGSGLVDTWPVPVPVLSLDQVWVSPEFEVISCRQGWSLKSDHRPVFVELKLR